MDDEKAFDFVVSQLEHHCDLNHLVARGTLRLALRSAGLDPHWVTWAQMESVVEKTLAAELEKRVVASSQLACDEIARRLRVRVEAGETGRPSPEDFLRRTRPSRASRPGAET